MWDCVPRSVEGALQQAVAMRDRLPVVQVQRDFPTYIPRSNTCGVSDTQERRRSSKQALLYVGSMLRIISMPTSAGKLFKIIFRASAGTAD